MVEGLVTNAITAADGYSKMLGELDVVKCALALVAETRKVQRGNLEGLEAILTAQAVTLNAMFTQLGLQASRMTMIDQIDRFTRLAFKAQSQCRATVETLALMKNSPTVFARQANIANGPQQVNNRAVLSMAGPGRPLARAGNAESEQNKLLEDGMTNGWTPERRVRQAQAIRRWHPWEKSTGPRTAEGKARCSRNAYRGGQWRLWREMIKRLNAAMRAQRETLTDFSEAIQVIHPGTPPRRRT